MGAARREAQVNGGLGGVLLNHAAEQVGREATDEAGGRAESRHADGDVVAGAADMRAHRAATVGCCDREEVDQRFAAA